MARIPVDGSPVAGRRAHGDLADRVLLALLLLYLASMALEGPLRYGLITAGLPNALYLRDAIPVGSLAFLFMRELWTRSSFSPRILVPAAVLLAHAACALIAGIELFPILFGLKIFLFIPYGIAMWPLVRARFGAALAVAAVLYAVSLAGIAANVLVGRMPWEGLSYDTAFGPSATTREWWTTDDIARLPGLARTSFNAAMILGITGLLTAIRFPSLPVRLGLAVLTLLGILATTSKGMVLAYLLATAWLLADPRARHPLLGRTIIYALAALTLLLPTLVVLLDLASAVKAASFPDLLVSVWERFATMWPRAFDLLPPLPGGLLGAGLGGIGTPQEFGSRGHLSNAGDSVAIYLIVDFGLIGVLYYCLPAIALAPVQRLDDLRIRQAFTVLVLVAYGYGISVNMLEDSFFSICIGLALGSCPWPARPTKGQHTARPTRSSP